MKLKYYMRGMGIGVFVTTLIFLIAIAFMKPNTTAETTATVQESGKQTIKEEQEKEEPVQEETVQEETEEETPEPIDEKQVETTVDEDGTVTTVETIPGATGEPVSFTIQGGEGSATVGNKLQDAGLVDSGSRFNRYLEDNNYDNVIQPGTYSIPKGSTYEEVAQIITTRQ
ncbi:MAG: endolytic transglycosylase MltG [Lachnospiraceae bacterium]|nr:endolytic transglycosylase MltG [Lachnospiraceae bacterium]